MSAVSPDVALAPPLAAPNPLTPLFTLARRRFQLSTRTPRDLVVPLITPVLFALVIAPALKTALHTSSSYESYVATGTIGLLIPLNTMFSGIGVLVDREIGALSSSRCAPVSRSTSTPIPANIVFSGINSPIVPVATYDS